MGAGFPVSVPSHTVTMACISANQAITSGEREREREGGGEDEREGERESKEEGEEKWRGRR